MNPLTNKKNSLIGLIGCGVRMRAVIRNLFLHGEDQIAVGAICDPDSHAIIAFKEEFGTDIPVYDSVEELVRHPGLSWVLVGSINSLHATHAIQAMEAGNHVFCEKPLATNLEDCLAIQQTLQKTGCMFSLGLVFRYSRFYSKIKEIISSGTLGELISFECNETLDFNHGGHIFGCWRRFRELSGSHALEKCCHNFDLANWLLESVPVRAASFGGNDFFVPRNEHHIERLGANDKGQMAYQTWPGYHPYPPFSAGATVVDNQVGILEYANGVRGTFHTNSNSAILERRFYFCGSEGTLRTNLMEGTIEVKRIGFDTEIEQVETGVKGGHGGGDSILARNLANSILHGAPPLATAEDGIKSSFTAFALNESMDTGRVVNLQPMWDRMEAIMKPHADPNLLSAKASFSPSSLSR